MALDFSYILIIDISPLLAKSDDPKMAQDPEVLDVVAQLDKACTQAGFFYVKGHGIPDTLLKGVRDITRTFFELPYEEKAKIKMTPANGFRGYEKMGENLTEGTPDMHEAIDCYREVTKGMYGDLGKVMEGCNQWPQNPPKFNLVMEEYIGLCKDLARKIMRGIALALGGSPYEFEGDRAGDPFWVMRIIGYPGVSTVNDIGWFAIYWSFLFNRYHYSVICCIACNNSSLLYDILLSSSLLSCLILFRYRVYVVKLLKVKNLSGEWISASPVPGSFVCNIGDMLKTNFDAVVEPLDTYKTRTNGDKRSERAVYGEHLVRKVLTNFVEE
ncbi:hypothetical protein KIW84_042609 [Lathyrus oleraceus]|uniref:Non-haem dioxygenase N-terminal domain-containing protein n=1 Tax=Pisum sativum TaxID=3888 RepID=A0A9D4XBL4_PEA|nr:hypothetical protein KIW84_042609 [Pisum sativum]